MSDELDLGALDQHHEPRPDFRVALGRRVAEIVADDRSAVTNPDVPRAEVSELQLAPQRALHSARRVATIGVLVASSAAAVIAIAVFRSAEPSPIDSPATESTGPTTAIEEAGPLITPSAEEVARASDTNLYQSDSGPTQVSSAGNYLSLRTCRPSRSAPATCPSGWAYMTGSVDGSVIHRGLLGAADLVEAYGLDDRFFVALSSSPASPAGSVGWLIDSITGQRAQLRWSGEPVRIDSAEQALLLFADPYPLSFSTVERFLPRVVDTRDGTIRPLSVPDDAVADLPVVQRGSRIWVGTAPQGADLGLAYSDDGGALWTEVTLPAQLRPTNAELAQLGEDNDKILSIAADGDRIAATFSWPPNADRNVYVSSDAGKTWSTAASSPSSGNGAHLYVLADQRLVMVWSTDPYPSQLLASTGPTWLELEDVSTPEATGHKYFSVNQAGVFSVYSLTGEHEYRIDFSTDLANWWTVASLDD